MATLSQNVYLEIPIADMDFFKSLTSKMGWKYETKADFINRYISSRPTNCDLSDEDIMAEINAVRYKQ